MNLSFDGRTAIVTGAGAGLGRSHALLLASRGASLVINDVSAERAGEVVAEIVEAGGKAVADTHSIATPEGGNAVVETAVQEFGRIDIVVNNAGIVRDKTFAKMTPELLEPVLDVHLKGAFYVTVPAYRYMKEQGYGRIISTSSAAGLYGNFGQTSYGAAKMGLVGMTRVLALESAKYGIVANVVAPIAATAMSEGLLDEEWERRLRPEYVSSIVACLAHESCEVSGEIFSAAAGRVARVFIAEGPGYYSADLTPEQLIENWDAVVSEKDFSTPMSAEAERDLIERSFS